MKELLKFKTFTALTEGVSQSTGNPWRKITAIFETLGDRPHDIAFSALNDTCNRVAELKPGMVYEVNFDLNSRDYNGKWYTDAKAWAIIEPNAFDKMPQQPAAPAPQPKKAVQTSIDTLPPIGSSSDDLPF